MVTFLHSILNKVLLCFLLMGLAESAAAHTYFFGVSDLNINNTNEHIEVIHQFTAHDIENTIAEIKQINFSPEHPQYDQFIQDYIEKNFILERNHIVVKLSWIGFEVKRGKLFAYQESDAKNYLTNLVVKNAILVDTYKEQVNTVNYRSASSSQIIQGSLTFDKSLKVAMITFDE